MDRQAIRKFVAAVFGIAMGIATLHGGEVSSLSANGFLEGIQTALVFALVPGLLPSAMIGNLWIGCFVNGILYYFLTWIAFGLVLRSLGRSREVDTPPTDPLG